MSRQRSKGPYVLGGRLFATKSEAEAAIREVLYKYEIGEEIVGDDLDLISGVLEQHPNAADKIGVGVAVIRVRTSDKWGTKGRCFEVVRVDSSITDFSFQKSLHPASRLQLFKEACRDLVAPDIMEFRHRAFDEAGPEGRLICPISNVSIGRLEESHVDHEPRFDFLVHEFIHAQEIDVETVKLTGSGDGEVRKGFEDQNLARSWVEFHRRSAALRVVSRRANLSTLKRTVG